MSILRKLFLITGFLSLFSSVSFCQSKSWKFGLGNTFTNYKFKNSYGKPIEFLKSGSGNLYVLGFESAFLDTTQLSVTSSNKSIYFLKHTTLAKLLSKVNFGFNISLNQYNAVGNIQNLEFDYQTNYMGLGAFLSPKLNIGKGWQTNFTFNGSIQRILQGNQRVNSNYINLVNQTEFNPIMLFVGYGIELQKNVNKSISLYLSGTNNQSLNSQKLGQENLNFQTTQILLGVKITNIN